ncbi:MAG: N-(5'-phosphoribosyl)anthranilate isomerase, partial [Pseudomonadota bacterium]
MPEAAAQKRAATDAIRVKICGLRTVEAVEAAAQAGAAYVGLVFYPPSPRALTPEAARALALATPPGIAKVGLFVDATDDELDAVLESVPLDILQLQGSESPERVAELRARHGLPAMKAIGVREAADLDAVERYAPVADQL